MVENATNKRLKTWTIIGIVISWLTFWIFLLSPFGLIFWLGILIYLVRNHAPLKGYLALSAWLFVPVLSFLVGTGLYATGRAATLRMGMPERYLGINRETRTASIHSGCIPVGFEPFVFPANNAAVGLWTNLFGFQRDAYSGVFPTRGEAQEIVKLADTITVERTEKFLKFNVDERTVMVDTLAVFTDDAPSETFDRVVGKMIKNECFIFQRLKAGTRKDLNLIYIVDINKGKLLEAYFDR